MAAPSTSRTGLTPSRQIFLFAFLTISIFASCTSALNFVAGSKCESVCSDSTAGTVHDNVRCLDDEFDYVPASHMKDCVTCQLNSTAVDPLTKMTDVQWALFNLRYILSNCMFAYPEERVSISSPCQVSCAPLKRAVTFHISDSLNTTDYSGDLGFCTGGQFDDATINNCAFCYSFIPQQLILGNFLQALHTACVTAPTVGKTFYPDGIAIFNQSTVPGPVLTPPKVSSTLTGTALALAIVLPLLAGVAIGFGMWICCKRWRVKVKASGKMAEFQEHIREYSPMSARTTSPPQQYKWHEPPQEMQRISVMPKQANTPIVQVPVPRSQQDPYSNRWAQHAHEDSSTPLTSPDRATYAVGDVKDAQYADSKSRDSPPIQVFHAQDGYATESTHAGWKQ